MRLFPGAVGGLAAFFAVVNLSAQSPSARSGRLLHAYVATDGGQAVMELLSGAELVGPFSKARRLIFDLHPTDVRLLVLGEELRLLPGVTCTLEGPPLELYVTTGSMVVPQLTLGDDPQAPSDLVLSAVDGPALLALAATSLQLDERREHLQLSAALKLRVRDPAAAAAARVAPIVGRIMMSFPVRRLEAQLLPGAEPAKTGPQNSPRAASGTCELNPGPDIIVGSLINCQQFGRVGEIGQGKVGLSIGTSSCNQGCEPINWFSLPSAAHPLIGMNLYRLKTVDGAQRFEQVGWSWLKHGFTALQEDICDFGCIPSTSGTKLGVGCSDPYSTSLNAHQCGLGPRAVANPFTGAIPEGGGIPSGPCLGSNYPARNHAGHFHQDVPGGEVAHRIQVLDMDLMPEHNSGARYFGEAFYITADEFTNPEALANRNMFNNASHREVAVNAPLGGVFSFDWVGSTVRETPAVEAWAGAQFAEIEPQPGQDGKAILGWQVTQLGNGLWHYEYALYNMNLSQAIQALAVPIPSKVQISGSGFHAPPNHDDPGVVPQEQFSNEPWASDHVNGHWTWSSATIGEDPQANAIRFGTLYNFRFDTDTAPQPAELQVTFFMTAGTMHIPAQAPGPVIPVICGDRVVGAGEECDPPDGLHCDDGCAWICGDAVVQSGEECDPPNGTSCDLECLAITVCGNGTVEQGEDCDPPDGQTCDAACQRIPFCGDSILDPGEACDDGNDRPGDGCSPDCMFEDNDHCAAANPIAEGTFLVITTQATTDGPAHPECAQSGDGGITAYDRWFLYAAECPGNLTVSTCGAASYDTDLVIYDGVDCSNLSLLACNDDAIECPNRTSGLITPVAAGHEYLVRLGGWNENDPNSQGAAFLTIAHDNLPCPILSIVLSDPPDEAIDARQPSQLDGSQPAGWNGIDLIFDEDASGLGASDFVLSLQPPGPNLSVASVQVEGSVVHVAFTETIPPGHWTRLTFLPTGQSVRLGLLPGDVSGDRTASPLDILALVDHLNNVMSLPQHSTDIDRSGVAQPQDILRLIDLLNGAGAYETWNGQTLPE